MPTITYTPTIAKELETLRYKRVYESSDQAELNVGGFNAADDDRDTSWRAVFSIAGVDIPENAIIESANFRVINATDHYSDDTTISPGSYRVLDWVSSSLDYYTYLLGGSTHWVDDDPETINFDVTAIMQNLLNYPKEQRGLSVSASRLRTNYIYGLASPTPPVLTINYIIPVPKIRLKVDSIIRVANAFKIKIDGAWRKSSEAFVKVNGIWRKS